MSTLIAEAYQKQLLVPYSLAESINRGFGHHATFGGTCLDYAVAGMDHMLSDGSLELRLIKDDLQKRHHALLVAHSGSLFYFDPLVLSLEPIKLNGKEVIADAYHFDGTKRSTVVASLTDGNLSVQKLSPSGKEVHKFSYSIGSRVPVPTKEDYHATVIEEAEALQMVYIRVLDQKSGRIIQLQYPINVNNPAGSYPCIKVYPGGTFSPHVKVAEYHSHLAQMAALVGRTDDNLINQLRAAAKRVEEHISSKN